MDDSKETQIKEAFQKVRGDIEDLNDSLLNLRVEIDRTKSEIFQINTFLEKFSQKTIPINQEFFPTDGIQSIPSPTHNPTIQQTFRPLKGQILPISTGNGGVPTDRQTDQQTDNPLQEIAKKSLFIQKDDKKNSIDDAARILDSLDSLKKEIRLKFKQLTDQELLVFSTLYQLEEQEGQVDYRTLAERLNLTESSIRDYIGRLLKKGIPVEKTKLNNKQIQLTISPNLKKVASLSTILQLRDI